MAEITAYTVKQNQGGGLRLTLMRESAPSGHKSHPPVLLQQQQQQKQLPKPTPPAPSAAPRPPAKKHQVLLPITRVKTIMKTNVKSSQNNLMISQESVLVATKATELFIAQLVRDASNVAEESSPREVVYKHLSTAVRKNEDQMKFLYDILPEKVLARDLLASLNRTDQDGPS